MMTGRHGDRLATWITSVEQETLAPLASFARNLRRAAMLSTTDCPCPTVPALSKATSTG